VTLDCTVFNSNVSVKIALSKSLLDSYHSVLHLIFGEANTDYMLWKVIKNTIKEVMESDSECSVRTTRNKDLQVQKVT